MPTLNDTNSIWKTDTPSYCVGRQRSLQLRRQKNAQQVVNDKQFGETKYTALIDCLWIRSRSRMVKLNYILHNVLRNIEKLV